MEKLVNWNGCVWSIKVWLKFSVSETGGQHSSKPEYCADRSSFIRDFDGALAGLQTRLCQIPYQLCTNVRCCFRESGAFMLVLGFIGTINRGVPHAHAELKTFFTLPVVTTPLARCPSKILPAVTFDMKWLAHPFQNSSSCKRKFKRNYLQCSLVLIF